jgi:hypothetical protein
MCPRREVPSVKSFRQALGGDRGLTEGRTEALLDLIVSMKHLRPSPTRSQTAIYHEGVPGHEAHAAT